MSAFDILLILGDWCAKAAILFAFAWLVARCFPQSSATRRVVWILAFAGATVSPLLSATSQGVYRVDVIAPTVEPTHPFGPSPTPPLTTALLALWLVGTGVLLLNMLAGYLALRRAIRESVEWDLEFPELNTVRLRLARTTSPVAAVTWGWLRPVVLLPQGADGWSDERLRAVILHELAHVRRGDSLFQVLCGAVCAVLWFNPAAWLAAAALRAESEAAADEAVLDAGMRASDYASALLQTALDVYGVRARNLAGVSFMRQGQLEKRIASIVRPKPGRQATRAQTRIALGAILLASIGLGAVRTSVAKGQDFNLAGKSQAFLDGYRAGMAYSGGHAGKPPTDAQDKIRLEIAARKRAGLDFP